MSDKTCRTLTPARFFVIANILTRRFGQLEQALDHLGVLCRHFIRLSDVIADIEKLED